tara:strand:- start:4690 stop:5118 length:429 start_codon:yes stop_codon:yes gene_type:complete
MATLTVSISESVTLNGKERGSVNTTDITGVTLVNDRIVSVGTAEQSLLLFDTAAAAGQFADSTVDYLRITNLDGTNFVSLRVTAGNDEYFVKISPGDSFVLFETVMDADSASGVATMSLANIDSIKAKADSAACDVEIFVAA